MRNFQSGSATVRPDASQTAVICSANLILLQSIVRLREDFGVFQRQAVSRCWRISSVIPHCGRERICKNSMTTVSFCR